MQRDMKKICEAAGVTVLSAEWDDEGAAVVTLGALRRIAEQAVMASDVRQMTEVFVVFREGVYRRECGGVFSTAEAALEAAKALAKTEPDSYHTFVVMSFQLDARIEPIRKAYGHWDEPDAIYEVLGRNVALQK